MGNVLILLEHGEGKLRPSALSAIQFGLQAKKFHQGKLQLLLLGKNLTTVAEQAATYGADEVVIVEDAQLEHYLAEIYAPIIVSVAKTNQSTLIGGLCTSLGKDLFPRVAGLMSVGLGSDVVAVLGKNQFRRMTYAGNLLQTIEILTEVMVVTARKTEFSVAPIQKQGASNLINFPVGKVEAHSAEFVRTKTQERIRPELTDAKIVVSGGRGLKEKQNFSYLEEVCDLLGAAMGASRAACDAGLVPNDLQVGQTGKIVAPELYLAIAISGAIQHVAGMKGSKVIAAINKDPDAPIFQVADYGLVARWEEALPELISALKKLKVSR